MKISREVRDYAAARGTAGVDDAIRQGMEEMAGECNRQGGKLYREN